MEDYASIAAETIRLVRKGIRWKPGKGRQHLDKRIRLGHLKANSTMAECEAIITAVVLDPRADVFIFLFNHEPYPTIVAEVAGRRWLAMANREGLMETAFPPDDPDEYLSDPQFVSLGNVEDILS